MDSDGQQNVQIPDHEPVTEKITRHSKEKYSPAYGVRFQEKGYPYQMITVEG